MNTSRLTKLVGKVVLVEWLDSHHLPGWHRAEWATEGLRCKSAGLMTFASADAVRISGHWTVEDDVQRCGEMTIPVCALVSARALK